MMTLDEMLVLARSDPLLMGILNMTPDSFSGEGLNKNIDAARRQALSMVSAGARIIDVGGESTRPGAEFVSAQEEISRVVGIIKALCQVLPDGSALLSVDTYKAETAKAALAAGAQLVNDVRGLTFAPDIAGIAAEAGAGVVITYNRGEAVDDIDVGADMLAFFEQQIAMAGKAGLPQAHIVLDPGVGFAKTPQQNFEVLRALPRLKALGCLVLVGVSRKSMFGYLTGAPVEKRLPGTLAAGLISVQKGAHILRVHDVEAHAQLLAVMDAVKDA